MQAEFRRSIAEGKWILDPVADDPGDPDKVFVSISFQPDAVHPAIAPDVQTVFEEVCRFEIKRVTTASEKVFPPAKSSAELVKILQKLASHRDKDGRDMADRVAADTCLMLAAVEA